MIMAIIAFAFVPFLGAGDALAFGIICLVTGAALGLILHFHRPFRLMLMIGIGIGLALAEQPFYLRFGI